MWDIKDHLGEISRQIMLSNMIEMLKIKDCVDAESFSTIQAELIKFQRRCVTCKHFDNPGYASTSCSKHGLYIDNCSGKDNIFEVIEMSCKYWEEKE